MDLEDAHASLMSELARLTKVFIWTGTRSHLLDPHIIVPGDSDHRQTAICGTKPFWPGQWFGQNDEFSPQASALPLCERCALIAARGVATGESA